MFVIRVTLHDRQDMDETLSAVTDALTKTRQKFHRIRLTTRIWCFHLIDDIFKSVACALILRISLIDIESFDIQCGDAIIVHHSKPNQVDEHHLYLSDIPRMTSVKKRDRGSIIISGDNLNTCTSVLGSFNDSDEIVRTHLCFKTRPDSCGAVYHPSIVAGLTSSGPLPTRVFMNFQVRSMKGKNIDILSTKECV